MIKNAFFLSLVSFAFGLLIFPKVAVAATAPSLGSADSFSVLGATSVTNTGTTTVSSDLGVSPGTSITNGGVLTIGGATHNNDATSIQAKLDLATAHGDIMSQGATSSIGPAIDALNLVPGVYDIGAGRLNGGVLTLNGSGVYIFRASSDFVTSGSISLTNGARACDVYWDVDTLATVNGTSFTGTIISGTGVHFGAGVSLDGRALARGGDVTMIGDTISGPGCASTSSSSSSSSTSSSSSVSGPSYYCPPLPYGVVSPTIISSNRIDSDSISLSWGPYTVTDKFNVRYGTENGNWLYNVDVTGFSTTLNSLPTNQPIWVQVAERNDCFVGGYGGSKRGGQIVSSGVPDNANPLIPKFPDTGYGPQEAHLLRNFFLGIFLGSIFYYPVKRIYRSYAKYSAILSEELI